MQIVKFLVKSLECLGLWKEVSFHLGFTTELQRCRLLPPAKFVSVPCKQACTYIISSVRAVSLSQGVFPLGNLSTSYKVAGQRAVRPPSLLAASEKAPWLYRFTTISSEISASFFSKPNLQPALCIALTSNQYYTNQTPKAVCAL